MSDSTPWLTGEGPNPTPRSRSRKVPFIVATILALAIGLVVIGAATGRITKSTASADTTATSTPKPKGHELTGSIEVNDDTPTTEQPTTSTVPASVSCSNVVTAAAAWSAAQGPSYSTNGGFQKFLTLQSAMIVLSNDWKAPNQAMFGARLFLLATGIPTQETLDVVHYCTT